MVLYVNINLSQDLAMHTEAALLNLNFITSYIPNKEISTCNEINRVHLQALRYSTVL